MYVMLCYVRGGRRNMAFTQLRLFEHARKLAAFLEVSARRGHIVNGLQRQLLVAHLRAGADRGTLVEVAQARACRVTATTTTTAAA